MSAAEHVTPDEGSARGRLHRSLSLPLITFYGLGTILGAGTYVLVGKVAGGPVRAACLRAAQMNASTNRQAAR